MQIEVRGPESFLEEFLLRLKDELENNAYFKGPKVGYAETGHLETYIKGEIILSLQIQEFDSGEALLHLESEQEIPDMKELWDKAVVKYGQDLIQRLRKIAQNPSSIEMELKKP